MTTADLYPGSLCVGALQHICRGFLVLCPARQLQAEALMCISCCREAAPSKRSRKRKGGGGGHQKVSGALPDSSLKLPQQPPVLLNKGRDHTCSIIAGMQALWASSSLRSAVPLGTHTQVQPPPTARKHMYCTHASAYVAWQNRCCGPSQIFPILVVPIIL